MTLPDGVRVVALDVTGIEADDVAALAAQIPHATTLSPRTAVTVPAVARRKRRFLRRILGDRKVHLSRATRCTALLVRGYVDIAADDAGACAFSPG